MDQINLKNEMKCIIKFNNNFYNDGSVVFPIPIVASQSVIIESFQNGVNIGTYIKQVEIIKENSLLKIKQIMNGSLDDSLDRSDVSNSIGNN